MSKSKDRHQHTAVITHKSDKTDSIRHMLKEQKKQCSSLTANPLFHEFWQRSKPAHDAQPPVIDDLEAGVSQLSMPFILAPVSAAAGT
jgi:hypothetical protein